MGEKIRGLNYLKSLLGDEGFKASVIEARESDEFARQVLPGRIILDYGIPSRFWNVLDHYIDTGELDESLVKEPVRVTYEEGEGVALKLSHDITQPELRAFIDKHWKDDISPKLSYVGKDRRKRLTTQPYVDRDRKVYDDHKSKRVTGLTDEAIGDKYGIDARTVRRIVKKFDNRT